MSSGASNFINSIDRAFIYVLTVSVFSMILATVRMIFFTIKHNRKKDPEAVDIHSSTRFEVTLSVASFILLIIAGLWCIRDAEKLINKSENRISLRFAFRDVNLFALLVVLLVSIDKLII